MEFENNKKIAAALAVVIVVTGLVIFGVLMKMRGDDVPVQQPIVPEVQQESAVPVEEIKKQIENFEAAQPEVKAEDPAKEPAVEDIKKQMEEAEKTGVAESGPSVEEIEKQLDQVK